MEVRVPMLFTNAGAHPTLDVAGGHCYHHFQTGEAPAFNTVPTALFNEGIPELPISLNAALESLTSGGIPGHPLLT